MFKISSAIIPEKFIPYLRNACCGKNLFQNLKYGPAKSLKAEKGQT